jgi:hypothetical protein
MTILGIEEKLKWISDDKKNSVFSGKIVTRYTLFRSSECPEYFIAGVPQKPRIFYLSKTIKGHQIGPFFISSKDRL